ncbi:hypothetical protein EV651_107204 [Kribbella sp. VKM Ac-2571]|uniref:hypothetical protein n=1 Tax=Kribbella sp. VKM Ac-2571 TaxID=2512222 RepID=UPI00105EE5A4|nr:hypothetical protein [Kribbella sp. VKM Ac-2571]TDO60931.1 hypothetical protein EV651_107204 [Kribbella sp. VKM Ac-2571]
MTDLIRAPEPITTEERDFIARVENTMRPAFLDAIAREYAPREGPVAGIAERMSAAAPGHRLQTAVEANMDASRHFDALPAEERSAAAQQAALVTARTIDARLTVQAADGRLGELAGKGADRLLRGEYEKVAHEAGGQAGMVLGGAINRARYLQVAEIQRQAGAGVTPPAAGSRHTSGTVDAVAAKPPDRAKDTRHQPHVRG